MFSERFLSPASLSGPVLSQICAFALTRRGRASWCAQYRLVIWGIGCHMAITIKPLYLGYVRALHHKDDLGGTRRLIP